MDENKLPENTDYYNLMSRFHCRQAIQALNEKEAKWVIQAMIDLRVVEMTRFHMFLKSVHEFPSRSDWPLQPETMNNMEKLMEVFVNGNFQGWQRGHDKKGAEWAREDAEIAFKASKDYLLEKLRKITDERT